METYFNTLGMECIAWTDENDLQHSMLKSAWDELQAQSLTEEVDELQAE